MTASLLIRRFLALVGIALALLIAGCTNQTFDGQPLEQLTVRFNADLTQHSGEYRLIRKDLQQRQCIWQLYADGALRSQGQIPLPSEGLNGLFIEASEALTSPATTTLPASNLDDQGSYLVQITYETPDDHRHVQASGSLARVARALQQSEQIYAIHRQLVSRLPRTYWFAHLDSTIEASSEPPQAQAR